MKTAIAFLLAAGLVLPATAQSPAGPRMGGPPGLALFMNDANQDGKVTKKELETALKTRFSEMDKNADGKVDGDEMTAQRDARREQMQEARFARLDANKDGQISSSEFAEAKDERGQRDNRMGAMRMAERRGDRPRGENGQRGGRGPGGEREDLTFERFSERQLKAFSASDTNSDGVVTLKEVQARAQR